MSVQLMTASCTSDLACVSNSTCCVQACYCAYFCCVDFCCILADVTCAASLGVAVQTFLRQVRTNATSRLAIFLFSDRKPVHGACALLARSAGWLELSDKPRKQVWLCRP